MGRPIPALDEALAGSSVEPALRELVHARFGAETVLRSSRAEVLKRRVLRFELELGSTSERVPRTWRLVGKVYESAERGAQAFATHRWLLEHGFRDRPAASIPEAYAYSPEARTLFMQEVGGESLKQLLKSARARPQHLRRCADGLAALHGCPAAFGEAFTLDDHLERRCAGLVPALARALPEFAPGIERILDTARRHAPPATTVAHGDFHPGQVHLDGERLWILDLDPLHQGDPAYDLAMVVVQLELLRLESQRDDLRALTAAFLERYVVHLGLEHAQRIPIHAALILLKRACKRFRYQDDPGWKATAGRQIASAAAFAALQDEHARLGSLDELLVLATSLPTVA